MEYNTSIKKLVISDYLNKKLTLEELEQKYGISKEVLKVEVIQFLDLEKPDIISGSELLNTTTLDDGLELLANNTDFIIDKFEEKPIESKIAEDFFYKKVSIDDIMLEYSVSEEFVNECVMKYSRKK